MISNFKKFEKLNSVVFKVLTSSLIILLSIAYCVFPKNFYESYEKNKTINELVDKNLRSHRKYSVQELSALDEKIKDGSLHRLARIEIKGKKVTKINNEMDLLKPRLYMIFNKISRLANAGLLKDNTFLLHYDDGITPQAEIAKHAHNLPPIFVFSVNKTIHDLDKYILFPDDYTIGGGTKPYWIGWKAISSEIKDANLKYPWDKKIQKLLWRGRPTDRFVSTDLDGKSVRMFLVEVGKTNPNIDAKFSAHMQILSPYELDNWKWDPFMTRSSQVEYKYLISLDGITATYPGLLWKLASNSVVVKQDSDNVQWFYSLLKPWESYVPIDRNLSNLKAVISWLQTHDYETRKISLSAQKIVEKYISPQAVDDYIVLLLNRWSENLENTDF